MSIRDFNVNNAHRAQYPSDDRMRCDCVPKYLPGAHETSNDTLKAEGSTQKSIAFVKGNFAHDGNG